MTFIAVDVIDCSPLNYVTTARAECFHRVMHIRYRHQHDSFGNLSVISQFVGIDHAADQPPFVSNLRIGVIVAETQHKANGLKLPAK
jgi:hypothetical protein